MTCSCGCTAPHKIARRQTADSIRLDLWSDGSVTSGIGIPLPGIGTARSSFEADRDLAAGWLACAEIELYDASEVTRLVRSARRAVRQRSDSPRAAMLNYFAGRSIRTLKAGTFRWENR